MRVVGSGPRGSPSALKGLGLLPQYSKERRAPRAALGEGGRVFVCWGGAWERNRFGGAMWDF